jgi:hypothetical protein
LLLAGVCCQQPLTEAGQERLDLLPVGLGRAERGEEFLGELRRMWAAVARKLEDLLHSFVAEACPTLLSVDFCRAVSKYSEKNGPARGYDQLAGLSTLRLASSIAAVADRAGYSLARRRIIFSRVNGGFGGDRAGRVAGAGV